MSEYKPAREPSEVSPDWIIRQMAEKKLSQTDLVHMSGIDKSNISTWISGSRPMSKIAKAMFYFMLK